MAAEGTLGGDPGGCALCCDILGEEDFAAVRSCVVSAADTDLSSLPQRPESFTQGTFWCPLREPCAAAGGPLQRAAPGDYEGAEWWWQEQDSADEPKEFHIDCDLQLSPDGQSTRRLPAVSSVFYLDGASGALGPTVVFSAGLSPPPRAEDAALCVSVVPPVENSLLMFDGRLFHGVLWPQERTKEGAERRTLLVNYWLSRPGGPADLPDALRGPVPAGGTLAVQARWLQPDACSVERASFADDAPEWLQQRLPRAAAAEWHAGRPLRIRYTALGEAPQWDWTAPA
eukprot:TRINITY_DN30948_c0_g1_i1.p1 TRINITY_DN30948_c0_g1~~TRINITY_DN30948_c0_g1_i1.p1  ORF type:complete len:308 (+),score=63.23 TRINITY_DN30948_c0_g1_i1:69-926(+)